MPAQQRVGLDEVKRVPPGACAPGEGDQQEPVRSPESWALHTSPQDDELLAKEGVLGNEIATASRRVANHAVVRQFPFDTVVTAIVAPRWATGAKAEGDVRVKGIDMTI